MDFNDAFGALNAELNPRPWAQTTGSTTITATPEGAAAERDEAKVILTITQYGIETAELYVATPDVAACANAIASGARWSLVGLFGERLDVANTAGGDLVIDIAASGDPVVRIAIPTAQRMPIAVAMRRAHDIARRWEQ